MVWSDGCSAKFRSRFVSHLMTESNFNGVELSWFYNEKSHVKGPMNGVGGTVKNVVFREVKSGFLIIYTPFEFHEAATKYVPAIKSIYLSETKEPKFEEPKNIDQEVEKMVDTLKVHKVERCEVKGIYGLRSSIGWRKLKVHFIRSGT